ncbi:MAG: hypothetical protein WCT37_03540 [Patescibacteria group bacterium]|jgi:hypothetical protein
MAQSKKIILSLILVGLLIVPIFCLAANDKNDFGLNATATATYGTQPNKDVTLPSLAGQIVGVILSVLGVIFLVEVIVAGIAWLTAGGEEEKITKAKQNLLQSTIGLVIVVGAFVIVNFVLTNLMAIVINKAA